MRLTVSILGCGLMSERSYGINLLTLTLLGYKSITFYYKKLALSSNALTKSMGSAVVGSQMASLGLHLYGRKYKV